MGPRPSLLQAVHQIQSKIQSQHPVLEPLHLFHICLHHRDMQELSLRSTAQALPQRATRWNLLPRTAEDLLICAR